MCCDPAWLVEHDADGLKASDHQLTDLQSVRLAEHTGHRRTNYCAAEIQCCFVPLRLGRGDGRIFARHCRTCSKRRARLCGFRLCCPRSEEHTSELQSLMRISYAVLCLKQTTINHSLMTNTLQNNITNSIIFIHITQTTISL